MGLVDFGLVWVGLAGLGGFSWFGWVWSGLVWVGLGCSGLVWVDSGCSFWDHLDIWVRYLTLDLASFLFSLCLAGLVLGSVCLNHRERSWRQNTAFPSRNLAERERERNAESSCLRFRNNHKVSQTIMRFAQ